MSFKEISPDLKFSKNDPQDPRLGEWIINDHGNITILGYPDDEGIKLNSGRPGAALGPENIRKYFYRMTPSDVTRKISIQDLGDLDTSIELAKRHEIARKKITELCAANKYWVSLGGGHDYGYSDSCGFAEVFKSQAIIINIDAHLDVRPVDKGFNSGTPFYRLLNEFKNKVTFYEFGIQPQCNSPYHLSWAKQHGAKVFTLAESQGKFLDILKSELRSQQRKKIFISLDVDAINSTEAAGCSQSWPAGFSFKEVNQVITYLASHFDVQGLGIYEVAPPLESENRTAKLAALILYNYLFSHARIWK